MTYASLSIAALTLAMTACQNGGKASENEATITVSGQNLSEGDTLVLATASMDLLPLDTAVVADGQGTIRCEANEHGTLAVVLTIKNGEPVAGSTVLLTPGMTMNMELPTSPDQPAKTEGSKDNELWNEVQGKLAEYMNEAKPYIIAMNTNTGDVEEAKAKIEQMGKDMERLYASYIIDNAPSVFSDIMLGQTFQSFEDSTLTTIMEALSKFEADSMPNYIAVKEVIDSRVVVNEGQQFIDFTLPTMDGGSLHLAEVVKANKLTLVDFWASWCGPCRNEMPFVAKAYDKFKGKGFTVVGVSLDNNGEDWKAAVEQLGMKWPQVSEINGWDGTASHSYGVDAIPASFLINSDGVIVAKGLRGEELLTRVSELLK